MSAKIDTPGTLVNANFWGAAVGRPGASPVSVRKAGISPSPGHSPLPRSTANSARRVRAQFTVTSRWHGVRYVWPPGPGFPPPLGSRFERRQGVPTNTGPSQQKTRVTDLRVPSERTAPPGENFCSAKARAAGFFVLVERWGREQVWSPLKEAAVHSLLLLTLGGIVFLYEGEDRPGDRGVGLEDEI
jgi:hypothetical protein